MIKKQGPESPKFITLEEAAFMEEGTRVTFAPGVQAMFSEALKKLLMTTFISFKT